MANGKSEESEKRLRRAEVDAGSFEPIIVCYNIRDDVLEVSMTFSKLTFDFVNNVTYMYNREISVVKIVLLITCKDKIYEKLSMYM